MLFMFCFESSLGIWLYWMGVNVVLMELCGCVGVDVLEIGEDSVDVMVVLVVFDCCVGIVMDLECVLEILLLCVCVVLVLYDIEGWKYYEIVD